MGLGEKHESSYEAVRMLVSVIVRTGGEFVRLQGILRQSPPVESLSPHSLESGAFLELGTQESFSKVS